MDQMADEITLRGDEKDKGRVNTPEERATWVTGDIGPWETGRDTDTQRSRECDSSSSPLLSLKKYLRRSSSAASSTTDSVSSSQQSNMGVDCAGIVLNCLFCRFYNMINHCCPNYKQVVTAVESTPSSNDDSCVEPDCGLFGSCDDASDCLELAMELSELCYH